jgi:hypothetical protein
MVLAAADPSWKNKSAADWTGEEIRQILTDSPWARQFRAGVVRRLSEDELRDSGGMGQPTGLGYDDVDHPPGSGPKLPTSLKDIFGSSENGGRSARSVPTTMALWLRWESALPVRLALQKANDTGQPKPEGSGYRILVYGLPGRNYTADARKLGAPLKKEAVLRRRGKKNVKPALVEVYRRGDGWAAYYLFPPSAEISEKDEYVEFDARIGRIIATELFHLPEMTFQGKLELETNPQ